jgi:hypothetical protein
LGSFGHNPVAYKSPCCLHSLADMQTPLLALFEHLPPTSESAYGRINNKNKIDLILTLIFLFILILKIIYNFYFYLRKISKNK